MTLYNAARPFNDPSLYYNGGVLATVAAVAIITDNPELLMPDLGIIEVR